MNSQSQTIKPASSPDSEVYKDGLAKVRLDLAAEMVHRINLMMELGACDQRILTLKRLEVSLEEMSGEREPGRVPIGEPKDLTLKLACLRAVLTSPAAATVAMIRADLSEMGFKFQEGQDPMPSIRSTLHGLAREGEIKAIGGGLFQR